MNNIQKKNIQLAINYANKPSNSEQMEAFLLDCGILLSPEDDQFEHYAKVYDKEYGYYDEGMCYISTKSEAIRQAKKYVNDGVNNTYAVVSTTFLPRDFDFDNENLVAGENFDSDDVIYSIAKINGEIVEDFVHFKYDVAEYAEKNDSSYGHCETCSNYGNCNKCSDCDDGSEYKFAKAEYYKEHRAEIFKYYSKTENKNKTSTNKETLADLLFDKTDLLESGESEEDIYK